MYRVGALGRVVRVLDVLHERRETAQRDVFGQLDDFVTCSPTERHVAKKRTSFKKRTKLKSFVLMNRVPPPPPLFLFFLPSRLRKKALKKKKKTKIFLFNERGPPPPPLFRSSVIAVAKTSDEKKQ